MDKKISITCNTLNDFYRLNDYVFKKTKVKIELDKREYYDNKFFIVQFINDLNNHREYYFSSITVGACICSGGKSFHDVNEFIEFYEKEYVLCKQ